jgi:lactate racemase
MKDTVIGVGYQDRTLSKGETREIVQKAFQRWDLKGLRVLTLIPDGTRTAPIPLFFRLICEALHGKAVRLDFLIALGTHQPMHNTAINRLLGLTAEERALRYPSIGVFNHRWDQPEKLHKMGTITASESGELTGGLLAVDVPVLLNSYLLEYDVILICGPVFPHEVVGFSGGTKYISPGVSGAEIINFTHWLGALITSYDVIGYKDTPVRAVIDRVAEFVATPKLCLSLVVKKDGLYGVYAGEPQAAWSAAADLSAQIHVTYVDRPFQKVISVMPPMYDDLWTAAKGMYKVEPVVADGGEVVIYAPHIEEISYTHGRHIDKIGYHVRDYFVKQWQNFEHEPWGVLAHSTHLKGVGEYENGCERPRVRVTLATGIPPERCKQVNLGYCNPGSIVPEEWIGREAEGVLLVPYAGELLYRLKK